MSPTYLFYDLETTGLNKAFDQVLHFAAIRTDLDLHELERHEFKVKLNPDTVPAPRALLTHNITITEMLNGISELDAIIQIHQLLNEPGTISVGYNTLEFDDEFLRFGFYRNLLPPYTHQYANQCGRMDLYPITIFYYLYKNDILEWPKLNDEIKLKLELLNHANQLAPGRSHHAMVDVEATLALAKRLQKMRDMWDYTSGFFVKNTDQERARQLPVSLENSGGALQEGLLLWGKIGAANFYQAPVLALGNHDLYKNQTAWLRLDMPDLQRVTAETIHTTWSIRKKWGEPGFILPPKERFLTQLNKERQALAAANIEWLKHHPDLFQKIIAYHRGFVFPVLPDTDIDASLYHNGFWSDTENALCRRFHQVSPVEKIRLAQQLQNPKLKMLALRLLGRHFPDLLTTPQREEFNHYLQRIANSTIIDFKGDKRLSPKNALADIQELRQKENLTAAQLSLVGELESYLLSL